VFGLSIVLFGKNNWLGKVSLVKTKRQKDRETERQKDRKTEKQKDRKTERQKDRRTV
jgi:hypothetical protein